MTLAGDHEVVVAVKAQFDGAFELVCRHRRPHGQVTGLRFFAPKAAAHAPAFHAHGVVVQAQSVGHPVLHFTRVLGAGVHHPLVLLLGQHVGNLALQIEMFLPPDFQRAAQGVRCAGQRLACVAPVHKDRRQHIAFGSQGVLDAQNGGQGSDVELHMACRMAGLHYRLSHHQADDLADVLHGVSGKHGFITRKGGQHGVAGHIACQHKAAHARHSPRNVRVHA